MRLFLILALIIPTVAIADAGAVPETHSQDEQLPNVLLEAAKRGEEKAKTIISTPQNPDAIAIDAQVKANKQNLDAVLVSLVDEVEALKSKVVVSTRTIKATQTPKEKKNIGSKTVYTYQEGSIYEIHAGVDRVTDIELGSGEYLTNPPVSGDTARWKVSVLEPDAGTNRGSHIIIKPIEEDIETNLILTSNRNVYHLRLRASDWYMPAVSWNYPEDEARALEAAEARKKTELKLNVPPDQLNFNYEIDGRKYPWRPVQVYDDGQRTYLRMPSNIGSFEAPALFLLDNDDATVMVNYRKKDQLYIVDRLFNRAQMRVGKDEKIEITSDRDDRTFFERNF